MGACIFLNLNSLHRIAPFRAQYCIFFQLLHATVWIFECQESAETAEMIVSRSSVAALSPAYYFIPQDYLIEKASR